MNASPFSRRRFMHQAASQLLGVSALSMLSERAALAVASKEASTLKQVPTARHVIYLYMNGGMSHLDTWDPKPKQAEIMGSTQALATNVDGVFFTENLPLLARQADKLAVIRSMTSTQGAHEQGNYYQHTSYTLRSTVQHPSMGAWLEKFQGRGNPTLPGTVTIGDDSRHPGAGFFEAKFAPLKINDPQNGIANVKPSQGFTEERVLSRLKIAQQLDKPFMEAYQLKNVRAYSDMYDDAVKIMKSDELKAFDLSQENAKTRERYGKESFGQGCLLARRLVEHGVRYVEVSFGSWDTHNANFTRVPELCDEFDSAVAALLSDLEARGLLAETLVVVSTEFGRTPIINANEGRDHHPAGFSCVLAGGGIRGGQIYGATDERGGKAVDRPVTIPDFNATIAYSLGLPMDQTLYSPSKRPFTVVDKGKPIVSLFS
jgi:Protein of unknown function (DUF1501)